MIRKPLQTLYSNNIIGTSSSSVAFTLGVLDFDSLLISMTGNPIVKGGSMDAYIQVSPDGGTTYYDCGKFATVSGTSVGATGLTTASALWMVLPVQNCGLGKYIGNAGNLQFGTQLANDAGGVTSLPVVSPNMRLNYVYTASTVFQASWIISIYGHNQSGVGY